MDFPCSFFILRQRLCSSAGLELKTPGLFLFIPETLDVYYYHSRFGLPFVTASYFLLIQLSPPLIQCSCTPNWAFSWHLTRFPVKEIADKLTFCNRLLCYQTHLWWRLHKLSVTLNSTQQPEGFLVCKSNHAILFAFFRASQVLLEQKRKCFRVEDQTGLQPLVSFDTSPFVKCPLTFHG